MSNKLTEKEEQLLLALISDVIEFEEGYKGELEKPSEEYDRTKKYIKELKQLNKKLATQFG